MNVSLTPTLERYISRKVKQGTYQTASEVVRAALRAMEEREKKMESLREQLRPAMEQIERGEFSDLTMEDIKAKGRKLLAERRKKVG